LNRPAKRAAARKTTDALVPSRRTPLQDRSRKRVEQILDAAANVFLDKGYDAATTEEIARLAGTSIGSVYQFFPNKLAIFNAIALRYVEKAQALFGTFVTPSAMLEPWDRLLDRAIDAFAALNAGEPGFRALLLNWRVSADMLIANDDVNRRFARRAEIVLATQAPSLTPARRALVATMMIEIISTSLILCARRRDVDAAAVLAETKTVLHRYLAPIVSEHGAGAAKSPSKGGKRQRGSAQQRKPVE
jgi:AcrR family transcriptional regulator